MKNLLKEVRGNIYGLGCYCFKDADGKVLYVGTGMMNDRLQSHLYMLKRNLYEGTNKDILQRTYNLVELSFEVLHFSENNTIYLNATDSEKKAIQKALEVLENFYIEMYKDTICNKFRNVTKWSTSPNKMVTYKRKMANKGQNNPGAKYSEIMIANILWLKLNGYKPKKISELIESNYNIKIKNTYISHIGIEKWIFLMPIEPDFIKNKEVESIG